jgi:Domain of unknown function (DUF6487)
MAEKPTCLVCKQEMEKGFMTDFRHFNAVVLPRWCPGEPTSSFWTGGEVKASQAEQGIPVVAYRCPRCEALRLYAPSKA